MRLSPRCKAFSQFDKDAAFGRRFCCLCLQRWQFPGWRQISDRSFRGLEMRSISSPGKGQICRISNPDTQRRAFGLGSNTMSPCQSPERRKRIRAQTLRPSWLARLRKRFKSLAVNGSCSCCARCCSTDLRAITNCSQVWPASAKGTTRNLGELVATGLVARAVGASVPASHYALTRLGKGLMPTFKCLLTWGKKLLPADSTNISVR